MLLASSLQAQEPSAELVSLLDVGFYKNNGNFLADGLCLVFPPEGDATYELVVRDGSGAVKGKASLQVQKWTGYPVFDGLGSLGVPTLSLGEPGSYVMSVDKDGEPITSFPFQMEVEESGDPFQPGKSFYRQGPWQYLAFLASPAGKPDQPLSFHFWTNTREIGSEGSKPPKAQVRVLLDDEVVGLYKDPVSIAGSQWRRYRRNLATPQSPVGNYAFTLEGLLAREGNYRFVVEVEERVVKSFPMTVSGGAVTPHPRTSFDTQPHTDYIVPKFVDRSSGSSGGYKLFDIFWLESESRGN
ncbi:MAG: hypothetical protein AAGA68_22845 [Pseudomonadota bacterium]